MSYIAAWPPAIFFISGSIFTPKYGVNTTATTQDMINAMPTIQNMLLVYSPAVEAANPFGMKPTAVTRVPDNIGAAVWLHAYAEAATRL